MSEYQQQVMTSSIFQLLNMLRNQLIINPATIFLQCFFYLANIQYMQGNTLNPH